jgi:hypothetical protein
MSVGRGDAALLRIFFVRSLMTAADLSRIVADLCDEVLPQRIPLHPLPSPAGGRGGVIVAPRATA